jgi:DNA-binding NarL/FixJ family response regulator
MPTAYRSEREYMSIRVVVADDHAVIRMGIVRMLELEAAAEMTVVGEVADGRDLLGTVELLTPDIVLMDIVMPRHDVVAHMQQLAALAKAPQVIILTAYDQDEYVQPLIAAGVAGYLLKDEIPYTIVQAIRAVAAGETWFSQRIARQIVRANYAPAASESSVDAPALTPREWEILQLIGQGKRNSEIADQLALSKTTVQNYVSSIYAKLGVETRAQVMLYAMRNKLVDINEVLAEGSEY